MAVRGLGRGLPERVVTNRDLEAVLDTSDEWIRTRTGIAERRVAAPEQATSDLAVIAAKEALAAAGWTPQDLDLLVVATATPDMIFPSTACVVQAALGAYQAGACDISAACSGFVYALSSVAAQIRAGAARRALVIGAETLSKIVNWQDRSTAVLLGDGAGAVALERVEDGAGEGLLSVYLGADGRGGDLLKQPAGGSRLPASAETVAQGLHYLQMNGREVFKFAVQIMGDAAEEALRRAGLTFADVDLYVPHQANVRIIEASAKRFGLPMEKVWVNIDRYGNTSSASIPIALYEAHQAGRLHPGDVVLLVAFGGGLTWGAAVLRWGAGR
ncbi:MAG: ketoacyl-ACP synthase III [Firmicutes bacterium]|nr:ketoacyl-ACP synthase III [Bacillota bacterium]